MIARASILAAFALAGCNADAGSVSQTRDTDLWTDPKTGCRYILYDSGFGNARVGSLSIRFRADGKPDCPLTDYDPAANAKAQP